VVLGLNLTTSLTLKNGDWMVKVINF
jgi:hypothetical protein